MKKIYAILAVAAAFACTAFAVTGYSSRDPFFEANVQALSDNENGFGWLWEKHWEDCKFAEQIIVHQDSNVIMAGTYVYSVSLLARLNEASVSYTIIYGGEGQKSYCYDGWSWCSEDDCR